MATLASFEHVNDLIGVIHRCMRRFFESQMKKYDITPPQFEVLVILWNEDGLVLSDLGRRLSRDGPTITGIIDRMEKKQLLVRRRNTRDRRVIQVYLTEKAWEIKDNLMKMQKEAGMNITGNFSDQDIKTLEELLHKVLVNVEEKIMPHVV
jgi:MarR family transcriptional regulator, organic hydroperoxide resistance regulator